MQMLMRMFMCTLCNLTEEDVRLRELSREGDGACEEDAFTRKESPSGMCSIREGICN